MRPDRTGSDVPRPGRESLGRAPELQPSSGRLPTTPVPLTAALDELRNRLDAAADVPDCVAALVAAVVPAIADWCAVDLVDAQAGLVVDGLQRRSLGPLPHSSAGPLSRVLLEGIVSMDVRAAAPSAVEGSELEARHLARLQAAGGSSAGVVPLQARGRVVGALTLARTAGRPALGPQDLVGARLMAHRTAMTVQHLQLYEQAHAVSTLLQRSLLPGLPQPTGLSLAARYLPAQEGDQVGGDWYDAFVLPDDSTAVTIGDVIGHDLSAAAQMAQVRNLLRACAWHGPSATGQVLDRLEEVVLGLDVTSWATTVYCRLQRTEDGHMLHWSNAGHPPPLLLAHDQPARLLHRPVDSPIGLRTAGNRAQHVEPVPAGSTLLLYTDGLIERRGEDIDVGLERLAQAATEFADLPLEPWCDALLEILAPPHQEDDLALLAVRT